MRPKSSAASAPGPDALQLDDEPDRPVGSTRRLAEIAKVPEIHAAWHGAKVVSVFQCKSEPPMRLGLLGAVSASEAGSARNSHVGLWVEATVRMISGRAGIGMMLADGALIEEHLVVAEDGLRTFLPLRTAGQRACLFVH